MMKPTTKRLLIELVLTAVASPILLIVLLLAHAFRIFAFLAYPTLPLVRVISGWIIRVSPPQGGGWFPSLGAATLIEAILLPIWIWLLLIFAVRLVKRFIPRKEPS